MTKELNERFEKELRTRINYMVDNNGDIDEAVWPSFVEFVNSELEQQRKEIVEKLKGLKSDRFLSGVRNEIIDDAIKAIQE